VVVMRIAVLVWGVLAIRLATVRPEPLLQLNTFESVFELLAKEEPAVLHGRGAPPPYHSVGRVRDLEACDVETAECWRRLVEGTPPASLPPMTHPPLHLTTHMHTFTPAAESSTWARVWVLSACTRLAAGVWAG
jgi:hypothetical protein